MASRLDEWQKAGDERIWKLIISPEFGERLDLKRLTRELLTEIRRQTGSNLEWIAAAHYNTEHPHVHVALRGVDQDGRLLQFDRDFIQQGIRAIAEDLCTRQIGYRTERDAAEALAREVREQRYTSIDREIGRNRGQTLGNGTFDIVLTADSSQSFNRRQHAQAARLVVLTQMGLASHTGANSWRVQEDFESVLRAMQRANDHQRTIAAHGVLLSDPRLPFVKLDLRRTQTVEGRVLVHGEEEGGQGGSTSYFLVEGTDARVHYVPYTAEIESVRSRGQLTTNSFVRLRRLFVDGKPILEAEDLGSSDEIVKNRRHLRETARLFHSRGTRPPVDGWGGWLGRYQAALTEVFETVNVPENAKEQRRNSAPRGR